ncbi:hypothetical protein [Arcticibacterium luteifluviistationis]|uniref:Secretion system C-terminal sorting domain-containing protein n=1 Tax=Arcticibacterium luteifluviistationis TaxID=1784714 RepID=A0A2Z4GC73_9BACT|nr:hypothetical protein [Arcticibacterium luteifluviistationis]AWV98734.1 hypothetical protein DJ013_11345 [Arcticibacterium luteifluviistationis]
MKNIILILFAFITVNAYSQCTTCDITYTGSGDSNINFSGNQTLCITGNSGNLNINFNGTNNTICIADGVSWTQTNGLNLSSGTTINVNNGTLTSGGMNFNGSGSSINVGGSGVLNWAASGSNGNGNITINNDGALNFTNAGDQSFSGLILNNTGTVSKASGEFKLGTSSVVTNSGTMNLADFESEEANSFSNTGAINVSGHFYNHGAFNNQSSGTLSVGSLHVGNKGVGKEFINNGTVTVNGGDVRFEGPGINNGALILTSGSNLILEKELSGTDGYVYLENGTSTISGGSFTGTQGFYDANNPSGSEEQFDSGNGSNGSSNPTTTNALPINLLYFKGHQLSNEIVISWKVSDISNFDRFEVERSKDAISFERIGLQSLMANEVYNYFDNDPIDGQNYYRLKLQDLDGTFEYSKIISIDFEKNSEYMFFENPTEGQRVVINTNIQKPVVRILDLMGREVNFKMNRTAEGFEIMPKKYVYDVLIISFNGERSSFTKRAILR